MHGPSVVVVARTARISTRQPGPNGLLMNNNGVWSDNSIHCSLRSGLTSKRADHLMP